LTASLTIRGKIDGTLPIMGELNSDLVHKAIASDYEIPSMPKVTFQMAGRPPQLCKGCPHGDSFNMIVEVMKENKNLIVNGDIGCYSLGSLPPYSIPMTLVNMGASVSMAMGGTLCDKDVIGVIGDGTFIHSGICGLIDCVANNIPTTLIILDNHTIAMTGGQEVTLPSERLAEIAIAVGVKPEHVIEYIPLPSQLEKNVELLKREISYKGVSVLIGKRECMETLRKRGGKK